MLLSNNKAVISARSNRSSIADHFFCTNTIMETKCGERTTQSYIFPLYIYPSKQISLEDNNNNSHNGRRPNIAPAFIDQFSAKIKMTFISDGRGDRKDTFGPEDIFDYMYAVFHSPAYRSRYAGFLKLDFPRLPLTSDRRLFDGLCRLGEKLVDLHLMEKFGPEFVTYPVNGSHEVKKIKYSEPGKNSPGGRVWINEVQYFENVPPQVWEFTIGGYQVCQKWLKDRKGRILTYDDQTHYQRIVSAISETIRIMAEIDNTIDKHGGWPVQ